MTLKFVVVFVILTGKNLMKSRRCQISLLDVPQSIRIGTLVSIDNIVHQCSCALHHLTVFYSAIRNMKNTTYDGMYRVAKIKQRSVST